MHFSTSYQIAIPNPDRRTISSNEIHHNAITGSPDRLHGAGRGPVRFAGDLRRAGFGHRPDRFERRRGHWADQALYPLDYRCYWGATTRPG
jgi:hypothetical protein